MPAQVTSELLPELSADPILHAIEGYRGTITDLDRGVTVAPGELWPAAQSLAAEMIAHGLAAGDRLVVAVGNGPLFPATLGAILSSGGTPLLVHFETPVAEMKRLAETIGARFLVADAVDNALLANVGWKSTPLGDGWSRLQWIEVENCDAATLSLPGVPLHPTSGSTGVSKIAARPGFCALEEARHYTNTLGLGANDVIAAVTPMSHAYAYGMGTMVPLLTGASLVTTRKFSPAVVQRAVQELRVSVLPAVPAMLDALIVSGIDLSGFFGNVLSAGAQLSERTAHEFRRRTGVTVRALYGSTETGGITIATAAEGDAHTGVGCPMAGVEVDIDAFDEESHLGEGVGHVRVQSSSMMAGYASKTELLTDAIQDGWFQTGDLGKKDAAGCVHLIGRASDVINVSGLKVVPSDVESVLSQLPGMKEVKVYAGKRRDGTQFVKAAVYAPALQIDTVKSYCEEQFVYYKRPEEIVMLEQPLPRTAAGKILKANLP